MMRFQNPKNGVSRLFQNFPCPRGEMGSRKANDPGVGGQSSIGALRKTPVGIPDGHGEFADASKARGLISTPFVGRNSDTCCCGCREPGFKARAAALVRSSA